MSRFTNPGMMLRMKNMLIFNIYVIPNKYERHEKVYPTYRIRNQPEFVRPGRHALHGTSLDGR